MYLNIIAVENLNMLVREKGGFITWWKQLAFVCACVSVCLCVGVWVFDINLTTITDGIMETNVCKWLTINYINMLQNYCNVSLTYMLLGWLSVLKTSYCTFLTVQLLAVG